MKKTLSSLQSFQYVHLRFTIEPDDQLFLGQYPAITLRGGFGYALKASACHCPNDEHRSNCLYALLYEEFEGITVNNQYIPYSRPFIIHSNMNNKYTYKHGEFYQFDCLLFGNTIQHVQEFIIAFKMLGSRGLGKHKQTYTVKSVSTVDMMPTCIYEQGRYLGNPDIQNGIDILTNRHSAIIINFTTPLRLQLQGKYQSTIPFDVLIENLVRRLNSLLYFHHNQQLLHEEFIEELIQYAIDVETLSHNVTHHSFERYSTRQHQTSRLDGLLGEVRYSNVHPQLLSLLYLGQFVHIGKQTMFGLGHYTLTKFILNE